jgi:hypothetical protein
LEAVPLGVVVVFFTLDRIANDTSMLLLLLLSSPVRSAERFFSRAVWFF